MCIRDRDRVAPVLGPHVATVRGWLVADKQAPRKQRHTARRVFQRLVEEEGVEVAESSVRAMVGELRREIFDQSVQVKVPQTHAPGQEAEVDFGEFNAMIGGVVVRLWTVSYTHLTLPTKEDECRSRWSPYH